MAALFAVTTTQAQVGFESFPLATQSYYEGADLAGTSNGLGLFFFFFAMGDLEIINQFDTTYGTPGYW